MARFSMLAAFVMALFVVPVRADDDKPTKKETMDYIRKKVNPQDVFKETNVGAGQELKVWCEVSFVEENGVLVITMKSRLTTTDPISGQVRSNDGSGTQSCPIKHLDPGAVTVRKLETFPESRAPLDKPLYGVFLKVTDDLKEGELAVRGDFIDALQGKAPGQGIQTKKVSELNLYLAEERTANAVSKALQHLIRESGGKPSKRDKTDIFERDDTPDPKKKPDDGKTTEKPLGREAARKQIEKDIIDAEAQLPAAAKQDADNKEWNDTKRAKLKKEADEYSAKAKEAFARKDNAEGAAWLASALAVANELDNERRWRKDTGAADRVRQRIANLRKRLIDLQK